MKKRTHVIKILILGYLIFLISNLWAEGPGTGGIHGNELPFIDRIRNISAVSSYVEGSSNRIYISSFGLQPYRISPILIGIDAFLFRSTIQNSNISNWVFNTSYFFSFDQQFEFANPSPNYLPQCGRNAYTEDDHTNMLGYFSLEETDARCDGGTGSWASPVLIEGHNYLIVLNKSGVLMCINSEFEDNVCVNWAFDLREIERNFDPESCQFEFMATPTVVGDKIYIAGIYHIFSIDISDPLNIDLTSQQFIYDQSDHFIAPVAFDLNENEETRIICISKKGHLIVLKQDILLGPIGNFMIDDPNIKIYSKPLVDADGQIYIVANDGRIYYFAQELIAPGAPSFTCGDIKTILCSDHNFISTVITDGSKDIYAFTDENDILKLTEEYNFGNDDPISYDWIDDYIYQDDYLNFKAVNNHSVLFEKEELDKSCLAIIYNDDNLFTEEDNYYENLNPYENSIFVRVFAIDYFSNPDEYPFFYEPMNNTSTYGGLTAYKAYGTKNNCIWYDEKGFAWSWDDCMPSELLINFSPTSTTTLIPPTANPKFMRDLTNETIYDKTNVTVYIYDLEALEIEKIFLNSYWQTNFNQFEDYFTASFDNLLKHPNYTFCIKPHIGLPIVFDNVNISGSIIEFHYDEILEVTGTTTLNNGGTCIYQEINVYPGGTLIIDDNLIGSNTDVYVLGDVNLYNEGTIKVLDNSSLSINGSLVSDQYGLETGEGWIKTFDFGVTDNGFVVSDNIIVENNGRLHLQGMYNNDYRIVDWTINGSVNISAIGNFEEPSINIYGNMNIYGNLNVNDYIQFHIGSNCTLSGDQALLNLEYWKILLNNANINVLLGANFILNGSTYPAELHLENNSTMIIDNYENMESSILDVNSYGKIYLDNSELSVLNGADFNLYGGTNPAELHLDNRSSVTIDGIDIFGQPSKLFINWGSIIKGTTYAIWYLPPGNMPGDEIEIPGDRITAQNGGMITTNDDQNPGDRITISKEDPFSEELWDGIYIENPATGENNKYWFVNCDISGIKKLMMKGNALGEEANLCLYYTNFKDAEQILIRDGNKLTYKGSESYYCSILRNSVHPICACESAVDLEYLQIGSMGDGNSGGISMYDPSRTQSKIQNCFIKFNDYDGIKLSNVSFDQFNYNIIEDNSGFGMVCFKGTSFPGEVNFANIGIEDNGYSEYCGTQNTYNMDNDIPNILILDEDCTTATGADKYLLVNINWDGEAVDITGTNIQEYQIENLFPDSPEAWDFAGEISEQKQMLNSASNDIANEDYASAEQTLQQIISDYPLSLEASTSVYYLYHLENLTDNNFMELMGYLESISVSDTTSLYKAKERIITKSFAKNEDYLTAIDRLEQVINNSQIPDEVIIAMIDEGYCYLKLEESGSRTEPEKCTIRTKTIDEYQAKVRELEKGFSFYPDEPDNSSPEIKKLVLHCNYPNPFNPSTTISFDLPNESDVEITVYNIRGQKVKTLTNDLYEKGTHSVVWNGKDINNRSVATGIYFYKLSAGKETKVKKMLLLK